jgi:hypothetical protein
MHAADHLFAAIKKKGRVVGEERTTEADDR